MQVFSACGIKDLRLLFCAERLDKINSVCWFQCRKYHKSWWNGADERHISVDLLCGTTAAKLHNSVDLLCATTATELHNSVDLLCGRTAAKLHNSVDLLCGTMAAEQNKPVWCKREESHTFSKDGDEPCLIQSKILPTAVDRPSAIFQLFSTMNDGRLSHLTKR